jgi:hypothetical protein
MQDQDITGARTHYLAAVKRESRRLVAAEAAITQSFELARRAPDERARKAHERRHNTAHAVALDAYERVSKALATLSLAGMETYAKETSGKIVQAATKAKARAKRRACGAVGPDL